MEKYCDIDSNQEDDFADLCFDIIKFKKSLFKNNYIECAANDNGKIVGFALELKRGMTGITGNNIQTWHTYRDGIKIIYLDKISNDLINSISKQYGFQENNLKLSKYVIIECGSLTADPLDYESKIVQYKCFLDPAQEKGLYAEFYIDIDLKNKKVYLKEKDIEYRENIIKYLSM